jgi:hypothetical protein
LPPAAIPPTAANSAVRQSGANQRQRAAASYGGGMGGTIATGVQGAEAAPGAKKQLTGQ